MTQVPPPVVLRPVSAALGRATEAAVAAVQATLPRASVSALGSSSFVGGLSKGDVDVLATCDPADFTATVAHLDTLATRAQTDNWTATFASFSVPARALTGDGDALPASVPEVGVQLQSANDPMTAVLQAQQAALQDAALRARYDRAKAHAASLGKVGYWRVKDAFWTSRERPGPRWCEAREPVLKILTSAQWRALLDGHETPGAPVDVRDGFVHLSTPDQVAETVARHFAGQRGLWLLTLDARELGAALRWETSRGGALFPHLYAPLRLADVCLARPWEAELDW